MASLMTIVKYQHLHKSSAIWITQSQITAFIAQLTGSPADSQFVNTYHLHRKYESWLRSKLLKLKCPVWGETY